MVHTEATFIALPAVMSPLKLDLVAANFEERSFLFDCWISVLVLIIEIVEVEVIGNKRMQSGIGLCISKNLFYLSNLVRGKVTRV